MQFELKRKVEIELERLKFWTKLFDLLLNWSKETLNFRSRILDRNSFSFLIGRKFVLEIRLSFSISFNGVSKLIPSCFEGPPTEQLIGLE